MRKHDNKNKVSFTKFHEQMFMASTSNVAHRFQRSINEYTTTPRSVPTILEQSTNNQRLSIASHPKASDERGGNTGTRRSHWKVELDIEKSGLSLEGNQRDSLVNLHLTLSFQGFRFIVLPFALLSFLSFSFPDCLFHNPPMPPNETSVKLRIVRF